jgi:hypothetical protein
MVRWFTREELDRLICPRETVGYEAMRMFRTMWDETFPEAEEYQLKFTAWRKKKED